ncbi:Bcr/CflA family efflux MFS transporter [Microbacterium sp. No. 7]|uniref:Bcr/CflA family efflux MFS transporter n=1 Tax=Microbacterium sp. No. 7 TaxID=1714373 RepID=UPI0006D2CB63|nr:Bcr/CflA family efflux MFS transporter [Microbacterium sp. No. 7]ALJ22169.1 hypothetical protein AOA12_20700 [Microbacterium sp. No. 7]
MSDAQPGAPGLRRGVLPVLGFIALTGSISINMHLPALADMSAQLQVPAATVQLTIAACLIGLAAGQLVLGPLSDRFGRKRVLAPAVAAYGASAIAIALTSDVTAILALRFVQGFAGAAGSAVPRAIVADLTRGPAAVRALSLIVTFVALGPLLAPLIGGVVSEHVGWRGVFWVLGAVGVAMTLLTLFVVPESLPRHARQTGGLRVTFRGIALLVRDRRYLWAMLAFAFGSTVYVSFVAGAPLVAQNVLGLTPIQLGLVLAVGAVGTIASSSLNAGIATRTSPLRMLIVGGTITLTASATLFALAPVLSVPVFVACTAALYFGTGLTSANATALALGRASAARGAGAALLGTSQFALGGALTPLVGALGEHSAVPLAVVCLSGAALALTSAALLRRSGG